MKRTLFVISLAIVSCTSYPQSLAKAKDEISAQLKAVTAAVQHKDISAFSAVMAPDFTATDPAGKVSTREQVIASFKGLINMLQDAKWPRKIVKITRKGSFYETVTEGELSGKIEHGGKVHTMAFTATSQDEWQKANGKWLDHGSKLLKSKGLMDGKPMLMGH